MGSLLFSFPFRFRFLFLSFSLRGQECMIPCGEGVYMMQTCIVVISFFCFQRVLKTTVEGTCAGIQGKCVELPLISSRALKRTMFAPPTTPRARQTFLLHQESPYLACSVTESPLYTRDFNRPDQSPTDHFFPSYLFMLS